ncbi:MAG: type restriction enzyme subunit [Verrucomicrobiota bacterium]
MPDKVPKGWIETTLGEIRRDDSFGISQHQMRGEIFELYSVPAFSQRKPFVIPGEEIGSNKIVVSPGDVLLCKINPRINRAWVVGDYYQNRKIASTEWIVFSKQEGIASDFLRYFFSQDTFKNYLAANVSGVGGSLMRVRPVIVEKHVFPLPPTREQTRIVIKLNALLSQLAAGEAAARRAQERLKRYRAAVVHAAATGELTSGWRKSHLKGSETGNAFLSRLVANRRSRWEQAELARFTKSGKLPTDDKWKDLYSGPSEPDTASLPSLPRRWTWASVDQLVVEPVKNGLSVKGSSQPPGITALRLDAMSDSGFDFTKVRYLPLDEADVDGLWLRPRDFFVSRGNGSLHLLGRGTLAGAKVERVIFPDTMIRLRFPSSGHLPEFIAAIWSAGVVRSQVEGAAKTTAGIYKISQSSLRQFGVPIPPPDEQEEILHQVQYRLTLADRLVTSLGTALSRARAWRQSLLNTAFTGRLVPQSGDDESALVLLKKIRVARKVRAAQPKQKRGPEGRKKPMKSARLTLLKVLEDSDSPMKPEELFAAAGFDEGSIEAFFSELKDLTAQKRIREKRDPQDRSFVRLEVRR